MEMKRGVWHPREHPTQISRCVSSLPSNIHHPVYTEAMLPWGYSWSLTELGRDS